MARLRRWVCRLFCGWKGHPPDNYYHMWTWRDSEDGSTVAIAEVWCLRCGKVVDRSYGVDLAY